MLPNLERIAKPCLAWGKPPSVVLCGPAFVTYGDYFPLKPDDFNCLFQSL